MKIQSVAFRSTLAVSFVFAACYANSAGFSSFFSRPAVPKATLSDVVLLFGSEAQISSVNSVVASGLRACFKFPLSHRIEDNALVRTPPPEVLELARIAAESRGTSREIGSKLREYLNPGGTKIPVLPDVEGSRAYGCNEPISGSAAQCSYCNNEVDAYLRLLFRVIVDGAPSIGLNVTLNRFDLFHGHFLIANRRLGILFHAQETPICGGNFPCPQTLPYCERGSNLVYDESSMNLRNILWLAPVPIRSGGALPGVLVALDARPGGIIYRDMLTGPKYAKTIYEAGTVGVDVNYLNVAAAGANPDHKVIIC